MTSSITITRYPYEEPHHLSLVVRVATTGAVFEQEIYANAVDLRLLADRLVGFPNREGDSVSWELGSERPENRFAFHFRLTFRRIAATGRCAVEFRGGNHAERPERRRAEFSFGAVAADLDRFVLELREFAKLERTSLTWSVEDDALF